MHSWCSCTSSWIHVCRVSWAAQPIWWMLWCWCFDPLWQRCTHWSLQNHLHLTLTRHSVAVYNHCNFEGWWRLSYTWTSAQVLLVCVASCVQHGAFLVSLVDKQPAEWSICSHWVQQPNPAQTCIWKPQKPDVSEFRFQCRDDLSKLKQMFRD